MSNRSSEFWTILETTYNVHIPMHIKNTLQSMGYGNPISFQRITQSKLAEIEICVRTAASFPLPLYLDDELEESRAYKQCRRDQFQFAPGDKDLIMGLVERVREYSDVFKKLLNY